MERFKARLLEQQREGERWAVVLERTAFYPEGGGQPADRGTLNGQAVLDVQERGEAVVHYLGAPLSQDGEVEGWLDFPRRLEMMQQHTGQHIISAALKQVGAYPTVSVHLGETYTAVEIGAAAIPDAHLEAAETEANRIVTSNLPVRLHWVDREQADRFRLRRPPPEKPALRIVEIEGVDASACGGTHASRTGEVGLIRHVATERIRGRLRLRWLLGRRAYRDCRAAAALVRSLTSALTCAAEEVPERLAKLQEELKAGEAERRMLEGLLAGRMAAQALKQAERIGSLRLAVVRLSGQERALLRPLAHRLQGEPGVVTFLAAGEGKMHWVLSTGNGVRLPLESLLPDLLAPVGGRGGGRGGRWQGVADRPQGLPELVRRLRTRLREAGQSQAE